MASCSEPWRAWVVSSAGPKIDEIAVTAGRHFGEPEGAPSYFFYGLNLASASFYEVAITAGTDCNPWEQYNQY